ncbi:unnamed protein product [Kuraishia capsulata CBS 1993]|uniref:Uncharacterized protein n=1 Tax=Kuraishia capsulata CBS 1993 TaxID=1382522 RepID=W6MLM4_9ASCO|nr:uncharacterized protein KUCA_T00002980001 [Kuraishia capsulata CBS 1993]CDK27003.1 unnamed protein product [Kuraishia capsulata CBS 1993]
MVLSMKRSLGSESASSSKKPCLKSRLPGLASAGKKCEWLLSKKTRGDSSSSEDDESADEYVSECNNNKLRKQRRNQRNIAKAFMAAPLDSKLSKAVAQYSDDDADQENYGFGPQSPHIRRLSLGSNIISLPSPPYNAQGMPKDGHVSASGFAKVKRPLPESDFRARSRCFEYLITSIDEAWARYCDATTYAEDEVYGFNQSGRMMPETPESIPMSDEEEGYKSTISNSTAITDYESDGDLTKFRISENPSNIKLQELKDRLTKAKYYLQDFVDSDAVRDCLSFWRRWDLIKYATIDLVEDDDDDDVIENTIESLEEGRYYGSLN